MPNPQCPEVDFLGEVLNVGRFPNETTDKGQRRCSIARQSHFTNCLAVPAIRQRQRTAGRAAAVYLSTSGAFVHTSVSFPNSKRLAGWQSKMNSIAISLLVAAHRLHGVLKNIRRDRCTERLSIRCRRAE